MSTGLCPVDTQIDLGGRPLEHSSIWVHSTVGRTTLFSTHSVISARRVEKDV